MTQEWWVALLIGIGGTFQLVGLLQVIWEITSIRRRAAQLTAPFLLHGVEPTFDPRLTDRDREMMDFQHRLRQISIKSSRQEVDQRVEELDFAWRSYLHRLLTDSLGARFWGASAIRLGVVMATAGGVCAILL